MIFLKNSLKNLICDKCKWRPMTKCVLCFIVNKLMPRSCYLSLYTFSFLLVWTQFCGITIHLFWIISLYVACTCVFVIARGRRNRWPAGPWPVYLRSGQSNWLYWLLSSYLYVEHHFCRFLKIKIENKLLIIKWASSCKLLNSCSWILMKNVLLHVKGKFRQKFFFLCFSWCINMDVYIYISVLLCWIREWNRFYNSVNDRWMSPFW